MMSTQYEYDNYEVAARAAYYSMLANKTETGKAGEVTGDLLQDYNNVFNVHNIYTATESDTLIPFSSAFESGNEWYEFLENHDEYYDLAGDYLLGFKEVSASRTGKKFVAIESDERFATLHELNQSNSIPKNKIDPLEFFYRATHAGAEVLNELDKGNDISVDMKLINELFVFDKQNGFADYDLGKLEINGRALTKLGHASRFGTDHNGWASAFAEMMSHPDVVQDFKFVDTETNKPIEFADWVTPENVGHIVAVYKAAIQTTVALKNALDNQELELNVGRKFSGTQPTM